MSALLSFCKYFYHWESGLIYERLVVDQMAAIIHPQLFTKFHCSIYIEQ